MEISIESQSVEACVVDEKAERDTIPTLENSHVGGRRKLLQSVLLWQWFLWFKYVPSQCYELLPIIAVVRGKAFWGSIKLWAPPFPVDESLLKGLPSSLLHCEDVARRAPSGIKCWLLVHYFPMGIIKDKSPFFILSQWYFVISSIFLWFWFAFSHWSVKSSILLLNCSSFYILNTNPTLGRKQYLLPLAYIFYVIIFSIYFLI